ncbi:hypothetical protein BACI348_30022 [Bacillus altitudinis]|uniref:Uncharacterized protein n=1 Tax=Bacillus altitudinis TaxID=293387 RepID=A0A653MAM7_BACAB|nr:hypothetical protein BACI348_30022 [Bacillus altitudinis]
MKQRLPGRGPSNWTRKFLMDFLVFFNKTINIVKRMPMSKIVLVLKYQ